MIYYSDMSREKKKTIVQRIQKESKNPKIPKTPSYAQVKRSRKPQNMN
jgi:hypothetical protein